MPKGHFEVLVSTPEAFLNLSISTQLGFKLDMFCLVVFDEVHHMLKDHPYRKIAKNLKRLTREKPQVLYR